MENIAVSRLMKMIYSMSLESKLEILSKLSDNLKKNFHSESSPKDKILNELFGAWSDTSEELSDDILTSRTTSDALAND